MSGRMLFVVFFPSFPAQTPCPAGRFNNVTNIAALAQCLVTPAGYYTPGNSSVIVPCGNSSLYCPAGSGAPVAVPAGYYSTPASAPASLRTSVVPCAPGSYCQNGTALVCPGEFLSLSYGMTTCTGYLSCQGITYAGTPNVGYYNGLAAVMPSRCLQCAETFDVVTGAISVLPDPNDYVCQTVPRSLDATFVDIFNVSYNVSVPYMASIRTPVPAGYYSVG